MTTLTLQRHIENVLNTVEMSHLHDEIDDHQMIAGLSRTMQMMYQEYMTVIVDVLGDAFFGFSFEPLDDLAYVSLAESDCKGDIKIFGKALATLTDAQQDLILSGVAKYAVKEKHIVLVPLIGYNLFDSMVRDEVPVTDDMVEVLILTMRYMLHVLTNMTYYNTLMRTYSEQDNLGIKDEMHIKIQRRVTDIELRDLPDELFSARLLKSDCGVFVLQSEQSLDTTFISAVVVELPVTARINTEESTVKLAILGTDKRYSVVTVVNKKQYRYFIVLEPVEANTWHKEKCYLELSTIGY